MEQDPIINFEEALTFDDVTLVPRESNVRYRNREDEFGKKITTRTKLSQRITLNIPLVSANMDTITEHAMAKIMAELGGIGIIHRYLSIAEQAAEVRRVKRAQHFIIDKPITVSPTTPLEQVLVLMKKENISCVLVVENDGIGNILRGIISRRDLTFLETGSEKCAEDIMTKKVFIAEEGVSLGDARSILAERKVEKLPLITKDGKYLAGLITSKDLENDLRHPNAVRDAKGRLLVGAAIGVKEDTMPRLEALMRECVDVVVIDVAHGHAIRVKEIIQEIRRVYGYGLELIAGNIVTADAANYLIMVGVNGVKVGIGPGSMCTTRLVAGVGIPQFTAIRDVVRGIQKDFPLIADGGIKYPGDLAKAIGAEASVVMIGSLFAGTLETPGEPVLGNDKQFYKQYRGMASPEAMRTKGSVEGSMEGFKRTPEGVSKFVPIKGSVVTVVRELMEGLHSSMAYVGAFNIEEYQEKAQFRKISFAGMREAQAHGLE